MVTLLVLLEGAGDETLSLIIFGFHAVDLDVVALFTGFCHLVNDVLESGDEALRACDVLRAVGVNHNKLGVVLGFGQLTVWLLVYEQMSAIRPEALDITDKH